MKQKTLILWLLIAILVGAIAWKFEIVVFILSSKLILALSLALAFIIGYSCFMVTKDNKLKDRLVSMLWGIVFGFACGVLIGWLIGDMLNSFVRVFL